MRECDCHKFFGTDFNEIRQCFHASPWQRVALIDEPHEVEQYVVQRSVSPLPSEGDLTAEVDDKFLKKIGVAYVGRDLAKAKGIFEQVVSFMLQEEETE